MPKVFLVLFIGTVAYEITPLEPFGWQLVKTDGQIYTVHKDTYGIHCCECGDFIFRKEKLHKPCKHVLALQELRLL